MQERGTSRGGLTIVYPAVGRSRAATAAALGQRNRQILQEAAGIGVVFAAPETTGEPTEIVGGAAGLAPPGTHQGPQETAEAAGGTGPAATTTTAANQTRQGLKRIPGRGEWTR